uniref:HAP1 N-terminal domain-containing protein n=1 Tax=Glossina pallidipes TaxID=7398 RepID=A0A1A9ZMW3_GLOPL
MNESDILLAAELGKALLEKNEELVKQQEKLIEDYSAKIESLCTEELVVFAANDERYEMKYHIVSCNFVPKQHKIGRTGRPSDPTLWSTVTY